MHSKYINSNNKEIPSVTTVINTLNKEGLMEWANAIGKKGIDYKTFLENKAFLGSVTHELIEAYLNKVEPSVLCSMYILNKAKESLESFKVANNSLQIDNLETELSLSCEDYGGTMDIICDLLLEHRKVTVLADFKTSKKPYLSQFIQLGGYLELLKRNNHPRYSNIEYCMIISVTDKGCKIQYMKREYIEKYFIRVFLNLLDVYNSWNEAKRASIEFLKSLE